jgi:hypothetical protein
MADHTDHLRGTEWGSNEAVERAVHHFERNAKRKVPYLLPS